MKEINWHKKIQKLIPSDLPLSIEIANSTCSNKSTISDNLKKYGYLKNNLVIPNLLGQITDEMLDQEVLKTLQKIYYNKSKLPISAQSILQYSLQKLKNQKVIVFGGDYLSTLTIHKYLNKKHSKIALIQIGKPRLPALPYQAIFPDADLAAVTFQINKPTKTAIKTIVKKIETHKVKEILLSISNDDNLITDNPFLVWQIYLELSSLLQISGVNLIDIEYKQSKVEQTLQAHSLGTLISKFMEVLHGKNNFS